METYDVVIIGAGHNGLVCASYLLKAGYSVLLLEKRSVPGGAATTEEIMPQEAPGFNFNLCAIDHEFIHLGPVVEELELNKYGLEYLFCDPVTFCPHQMGNISWLTSRLRRRVRRLPDIAIAMRKNMLNL
jgi:beta-carotene ketolase (CrtO type)